MLLFLLSPQAAVVKGEFSLRSLSLALPVRHIHTHQSLHFNVDKSSVHFEAKPNTSTFVTGSVCDAKRLFKCIR